MKTVVVLCQIILFGTLVCLTSSCICKKEVAAENQPSTVIRYGDNGVPNFIKGHNLSASLDVDSAFQQLSAQKRYAQMVLYYLDRQRALFKLTSAQHEFVVDAIDREASGQTHVRLRQIFNEIPVWGKSLGVHINGDGQIYYVHGSYQPISSGLTTEAVIAEADAARIAINSKENSNQWRVDRVDKCVYAPSNEVQHLSFEVNLIRSGIHREYCFVDAVRGSILHCVSKTTNPKKLLKQKF